MNTDASVKHVIESVPKVLESVPKVFESVPSKMAADAASEIVDQVVEQAVAKAPKKETWISTLFRWFSYIFVFWIGILIVQVLFSLYATYMFNSKKKSEHDSFEVNDLKRAHGEVTFSNEPVDEYKPKVNEITDVKSDKTVFEILSGAHGPTVVLFYADWCVHCNNMMPAQEEASKLSDVPFVRIQGDLAPKTMLHFRINGQPTIYGVDSTKKVYPFATFRTKDEFVSFAKKMTPEGALAAAAKLIVKPAETEAEPVKPEAEPEKTPEKPAEEKVQSTVESIEVLDEQPEAEASE